MSSKELNDLIEKNDVDGVANLINQGQNVNQKYNGVTPLMAASALAHDEILPFLLRAGATIDAMDRNGLTALTLSCMHGYASTASLLIEAGADLDIPDNKGWLPIHHACYYGLVPIIKLLLSKGANIHTKTKQGQTALDFTCDGHYVEATLLVQQAGLSFEETLIAHTRKAKSTRNWLEHSAPSLNAVQTGNIAQLKISLSSGTDVNTRDKVGFTLLMLAAQGNHEDLTKLLLEYGADVNAYAPNGWTALERAANRGYIDMVIFLLEHGARVQSPFDNALSAIASAAWGGHIEVVKELLVLTTYAELEKALFQAKQHNHTEICNVLESQMKLDKKRIS